MSARLSLVLSVVAACGGGGDDKPADAMPDTPPAATIVREDPCPGTVAVTITTLASAFDMPSVTINQGQIVKIVSTATHPVGPLAGTEATLSVPEGQTRCFRFTAQGMYRMKCNIHGYAGMITVN